MCQPNNASMEKTYKAEVECIRKILAEKDKEIAKLKEAIKMYEFEILHMSRDFEYEDLEEIIATVRNSTKIEKTHNLKDF